jgi:16S rRNA (cytosine967-C5)-methyltransferase
VSTQPTTALWQQLQATAVFLIAIRAGESSATALQNTSPALRPGVQALGYAVLRGLGRAQGLRDLLARAKPPRDADALLCCALALASGDEQDAAYDAHTLVNQAVEAAKRWPGTAPQANFINACLRRFLRERESLLQQTLGHLQARWNHPLWWIKRLQKDHPAHWQSILQANNARAPMTLRVNTQKTTLAGYLSAQSAIDNVAAQNGEYGFTLAHPLPVEQIPGFAEGLVSVQDAAAQLAAPLLLEGLQAGGARLRLLDACAAPGGKTAHLAELAGPNGADLLALDIDAQRCERIHQNLQRLGLQAQVRAADAAQPDAWWDGQAFDGILLDAPCTASGIVRRHPDVRWLRRESDIAQLAAQQHLLLQTLWPLLRVGGRLLFCTYSVFRAEGELVAQTFLKNHTNAALLPSPGHLLPTSAGNPPDIPENLKHAPGLWDHDGFFYALLQKA